MKKYFLLFLTSFLLFDLSNAQNSEKTNYAQEELIYGRKDGMALTLVWFKPKISNGKAVIWVRSGNWVSANNGRDISTQGLDPYLDKGFTVFAVFHGSQPRYAIPDEVSDIKRAVRYIRFHAARFGIDSMHIGITGSSSGGNLSLLVATADEKINDRARDPVDRVSSRVQAVAVLFPPTDVKNWGGPGMNMVNAGPLLKAARVYGAFDFKKYNEVQNTLDPVTDSAEREKIGTEISPIYAVTPDDPPVFIIHGDTDQTVPLQQSRSIIDKFKEAGVPNEFIIKKGGRHRAEEMLPEWLQFVDFFEKNLK